MSSSGNRARDQAVERQPAAAIEVEQRGEIALGTRRAVQRAEDATLEARDRQRGERKHRVRARDADQHRRAARARGEERRPRRLGAGRSPRTRSRRPAGRRLHALRRLLRRRPPTRTASVAPSPAAASSLSSSTSTATTGRARRDRAHHRAQPDAPAAEHATRSPGPHAGGAPHGARAGGDTAADECRDIERHVLRDRDAARGRNDGVLGERRQERVVEHGPPSRESRGVPSSSPPVPIAAQTVRHRWCRSRRHSSQRAARGHPGQGHTSPGGERDPRSDLLDHTGAFVTQHRRTRASRRFRRSRSGRSGRRRWRGGAPTPRPGRGGRAPARSPRAARRPARGRRREASARVLRGPGLGRRRIRRPSASSGRSLTGVRLSFASPVVPAPPPGRVRIRPRPLDAPLAAPGGAVVWSSRSSSTE